MRQTSRSPEAELFALDTVSEVHDSTPGFVKLWQIIEETVRRLLKDERTAFTDYNRPEDLAFDKLSTIPVFSPCQTDTVRITAMMTRCLATSGIEPILCGSAPICARAQWLANSVASSLTTNSVAIPRSTVQGE